VNTTKSYAHTQYGYWHYVFYVVAMVLFFIAWSDRQSPAVYGLSIGAVIVLLAGGFINQLTVRDRGEYLSLEFGFGPMFRKRFAYADMTSVEPDRSRVIDGWGIHYIIRRGWIYNVWGFDCVKLKLGEKIVRIGTDDVDGLVNFLRTKIGGRNAN
jgi:hypothetical protein